VQETLQRAWRHRARTGRIENPSAWLARIAWRTALTRRGRAPALPLGEIESLPASGASAEELTARREMQQILETMLQRLPRKLREPLLLSTIEEFSNTEIAYVLGISEAAVRGRCLRARRLLQQKCRAALMGAGLGPATPSLSPLPAASRAPPGID
jgi:RNA polymerase sigma-70 factor (ECF subfamily)